jgi:hypothetical protein
VCGLVGIAGNLVARDDTTMKRLLIYDYFRGPDSTGLASIRASGEIRMAKLVGDPITLFEHNKFKKAQEGISRVYMGHNRAATRGLVNNYNAHPFEYEHVVGAHNGTLDQASWTRLEDAVGEKFAVDSQAMIAAIAKLGVKEAVELCTEGKNSDTGAWSLTWWDGFEGTINFLRNIHRPMWIASSKDHKRLFWASEFWMLDAAGKADNIEFHSEGEKEFTFFPTDADVHYKFDVGLFMTATEKIKPVVKEVKGREPPQVLSTQGSFPTRNSSSGPGNVCGFGNHVVTREIQENSMTTSRGSGTRHSTPDNVLHWLGTKQHPLAGYIDREKFDELAKYGCSWCQGDVEFGEPGVTIYERDDMLLCPRCSGNDLKNDPANRIYVESSQFTALKA